MSLRQVTRVREVILSAYFPGNKREQVLNVSLERTGDRFVWSLTFYVWDFDGNACPDFLMKLHELALSKDSWRTRVLRYGYCSETNNITSHYFQTQVPEGFDVVGDDFVLWFNEILNETGLQPLRKEFRNVIHEVVFFDDEGKKISPARALTLMYFSPEVAPAIGS